MVWPTVNHYYKRISEKKKSKLEMGSAMVADKHSVAAGWKPKGWLFFAKRPFSTHLLETEGKGHLYGLTERKANDFRLEKVWTERPFGITCQPFRFQPVATEWSSCTIEIGGLTPVVQVWDAYCGSRRFSVVWCETCRCRLKVYYSFCLFDDQELIIY